MVILHLLRGKTNSGTSSRTGNGGVLDLTLCMTVEVLAQ
jgi:hypothetical protein